IRLEKQIKEKGLSLVGVKIYFNEKQFVKLQLAIAKPKKLYDKRESVQKKEAKIEIDRALKNRNRS
ncbi:MAG TPA: SsrA-binding protein, partial [Leptospiraceae bacterium]|nr:SsrA-binding protein [Leptospiraceae bacterium]